MKYWIEPIDSEVIATNITGARNYLRQHPDVKSLSMNHFYGSDYVGSEEYLREEILTVKNKAGYGHTNRRAHLYT